MRATGMSESPTAEPVRANQSSLNCRSLSGPKRPTPRTSWSVRLAAARYHRSSRNPPVAPFVMDRPVLHAFVQELVEHEHLGELADALPTRARVSESALPLLLASLHERLERGLVVLLPEDADARDAAEASAWFLGDESVGLLPSRGVTWESGLTPPPHLVGERARALHVLAQGGLVCASARALAEGLPPADARPEPIELRAALEPGVEGLTESLALAGYERVERVDDRGQFAVRGGIVDVFPTTGREPFRIEFFGAEIESVRAFSPFTSARSILSSRRTCIRRPSGGETSSSRSFRTTKQGSRLS